jgi:Domain of unknown function (DUF4326)
MPKTLVGNIKNTKVGIKCDRSSALGNPFMMRGEEERDIVKKAFREYLFQVAMNKIDPLTAAVNIQAKYQLVLSSAWIQPSCKEFMTELKRVHLATLKEDTTLLCWCNPLPCHVEIIIDYFEWKNNQFKDWNDWMDELACDSDS